jgi:hypothetical protein
MAYDPRTSVIHNVTGAQHVALHTLRTPDPLEAVLAPGWFDPLASPLGGALQVNDRIWVAAGPDGQVRHADLVVVAVGGDSIAVKPLQPWQRPQQGKPGKSGKRR